MEAGGQGSDQLWKTLGSGPGPVAPFSALLTPQAPLGALPGAPGPRPPRGVGSWCGWLCAKGRISPSSRALLALQPPLPPHLLQHRSGTVWKRGPLRRRGVQDGVGTPWCWQCLQGGREGWVPETPSCSRVSVSRVRIVLLFGGAHRARSSPAATPGSWVFDVAGEGGDAGETEGLAVPPRL